MKTDDVIVKSSKIHDKGVFVARDFKTGEVVLHWDTSNELTKRAADEMPEDEKRYVSFLNGKYIAMQEPERYVNHSCEANTMAQEYCDIARQNIKKGEEITADYREELPPNTRMKCNCGSKKCVGEISTHIPNKENKEIEI